MELQCHQGILMLEAIAMRDRMKHAPLLSAVLLSLFVPPAFGGVPEVNVEVLCKARTAEAKLTHSSPNQSNEDCARDEEAAKQQLSTLWASTSVSIQNQCQSEARSLGMAGYIDLLACTHLAMDLKLSPPKRRGKQ
jgi:hypothetical protein